MPFGMVVWEFEYEVVFAATFDSDNGGVEMFNIGVFFVVKLMFFGFCLSLWEFMIGGGSRGAGEDLSEEPGWAEMVLRGEGQQRWCSSGLVLLKWFFDGGGAVTGECCCE